ncbi:hypothetical protein MN116_002710 [Schistosoma mekongi]|uniref:Cathepsin L n=1 Tax=Schistosoma mekongi TaxID=38744 RepID=A0AAE2D658_SCHME|nr:hypothetical protein MN116_002710 [Schistosoma mekongi]
MLQLFWFIIYLLLLLLCNHHIKTSLQLINYNLMNQTLMKTLNTTKLNEIWILWKRKYNKTYSLYNITINNTFISSSSSSSNSSSILPENVYRRYIWNTYVYRIGLHNLYYDLNYVTYTLGINQFSDLTWIELSTLYLNELSINMHKNELIHSLHRIKSTLSNFSIITSLNTFNVPDNFDWRTKNTVTNVKNQEKCRCGWAFASVGALEGQMKLLSIPLQSLSTQQLVDCTQDYGNYGCTAGLMRYAYDYVSDYGIQSEQTYPFVGEELPCQHNESQSIVWSTTYFTLSGGDEDILKYNVYQYGPFAGAISVVHDFFSYKYGIYQSNECSSTDVCHGILIIGYGYENDINETYWLLKNSWGITWGEYGYARIKRNANNMCGIAKMPIIPIIKNKTKLSDY